MIRREAAEELGRMAWIAWRSLGGVPMPAWDDLSVPQQEAFMWFGCLMAEHSDRAGVN